MASYRDFRGQRKMTVPSQFFMELPRDEMEVRQRAIVSVPRVEPEYGEQNPYADDFEVMEDLPREDFPVIQRAAHAPNEGTRHAEREECGGQLDATPTPLAEPRPAGIRLMTAAELHTGQPLPPVSPDEFHQGMLVRHPEHGLGRIVALSSSGRNRKATVDFTSPTHRVSFILAQSALRPVK